MSVTPPGTYPQDRGTSGGGPPFGGTGAGSAGPYTKMIGGIQMVGALFNDQGLAVISWDTQGNFYFLKKNTSQNPGNLDLLFADQSSLLTSGHNIWFSDNDIIAYSHFLNLGSDIPASPIPVLTAGAGAGTGPTVNYLAGTLQGDGSAVIHVKTGTAPAAGALVTLTFVELYLNEPVLHIEPYGLASLALNPYPISIGTSSYIIGVQNAPAAATDYYFQTNVGGV